MAGENTAYWTSFPITTKIDASLAPKYKYEELIRDDIMTTTNANYKATASLLDTTSWVEFKDSDGYAESAIGGPTIEMWMKSWNDKYDTNPNDVEELSYRITSNGYRIGFEKNNVNATSLNSEIMKTKEGYNNPLYYPKGAPAGNPNSYRLAAPCASTVDTYMLRVHVSGYVSNSTVTNSGANDGIRPVVCISSDVYASWSETDQMWKLGE